MKELRKIYLPALAALMLLSVARHVRGQDTLPAVLTEPKLCGEWYTPEIGYVGSQLFRGDWFRGSVILEDGRIADDKMLAYNGMQDQLIWLDKKGGKVLTLDKGLIAGFVLRDDKGEEMRFRKIRVKPLLQNDSVPVYAQVLFEGENISLYAQRKIVNDYTETYGGYVTSASRRYLAIKPVYLFRVHGRQRDREEKINRKTLYAIFPEKKKEIRKILRKNHLSLHNEYQLIRAIELIDQMGQ